MRHENTSPLLANCTYTGGTASPLYDNLNELYLRPKLVGRCLELSPAESIAPLKCSALSIRPWRHVRLLLFEFDHFSFFCMISAIGFVSVTSRS